MRMILAHVESVHARGAGQILRLGPLLPLGLVAVVAGFSRGLEWRSTARRASAIALLAAGLLHLALFPEHLDEGVVIGLFFLASTVAEVLPAVLLVVRPSAAVTRIVVAVVGILLVVYIAARIVRLPFTSGPEDVDGIGVVTKALEVLAGVLAVAADQSPRSRRLPVPAGVDGMAVPALALAVVAVAARPLLGEGPESLQAVVAIAVATAVAMALGERSPGRLAVAVADGAVLAFLARGPWWATALALPAAAELLRTVARRTDVLIITPVGVTLLLGLELRPLSERLEVLHVGHASDPVGALTLFLLAAVLSVAVWRRGQLPLTM